MTGVIMNEWPKSVLVVEDERTTRMMIARIVTKMGIARVLEAADGVQALSVLKETSVDFVVSDWGMPSINGLELMYLMHRDDELKTIPLLFLTARTDEQSVRQALDAGASGYLLKPFTPAALETKLKAMFTDHTIQGGKVSPPA
jgi:CheY-like chemotaxis protein